MTREVVWAGQIRVPTPATLKKYGYTEEEWRAMLIEQGGVCAICEKAPQSGILHFDHEHVRGWKKMPPEKRKLYVRALICQFCNRFVMARTMTLAKARNIVAVLEAYYKRRPK